ncbi:MAG: prepilin-type N-terminal cleavage/methylation domain-containing protein [Planctomycetota bacterium]
MKRRGFTLVELLVVVAIILLLMGLIGAAVSGARASGKASSTRLTIAKLDTILTAQLATYNSKSVDTPSPLPSGILTRGSYRSWYIRRNLITGDMPDRWADVAYMATASNGWIAQSASQRAYIAIWIAKQAAAQVPTVQYEGAECLFMIVMQGGIADCLDCGALRTSEIGDKDSDNAPEFLDAWGNPIDYILWAPLAEAPPGSGKLFFSGLRALDDPFPSAGVSPTPALKFRPIIYSAGPDGNYSIDRQPNTKTLDAGTNPVGRDCGNWNVDPTKSCGTTSSGSSDNITNFDAEAKQ